MIYSNESPMEDVSFPESQDDVSQLLKENATGQRQAIYPVGGRTADPYGYPGRFLEKPFA